MKAGKYRELLDGIDTDRAADEKIKDYLLHHQGEEETMHGINKKHKVSLRRGTPFYVAFSKISILRQAVPSVAFLLILAVILIGTSTSFLSKDNIPGANAEVSVAPTSEAQDILAEGPGVETDSIVPPTNNSSDTTNTEDPDLNASESIVISLDEALPETAEVSPAINEEESSGTEVNADTNAEASDSAAQENGFYFAWFDVANENNVKAAIPNLVFRFHGSLDTINPNDFTDIMLTKDGIPVDNGITMTIRKEQYEWCYEPITDFYFSFDYVNKEPGQYGLTGKYKGVPFTVYNKILEAGITDEPADPADFSYTGFVGSLDKNDEYNKLTELVFGFKGQQNSFYPSDLTDFVITCNGQEISFSYMDEVARYYEVDSNNAGETSFNLILKEPFIQPGEYIMKGNYKGVSFPSCIVKIAGN